MPFWEEITKSTFNSRSEQLAESITKNNALLDRLMDSQAKRPPPSRWRRFRWWLRGRRERLGEIVAGRRFDDEEEYC